MSFTLIHFKILWEKRLMWKDHIPKTDFIKTAASDGHGYIKSNSAPSAAIVKEQVNQIHPKHNAGNIQYTNL